MMILAAHQPQYLPWLGYFDKILKSDRFVFLDCVQYEKRGFQNRNKIRTPKGSIWLTVPVISKGRYHQLLKDVRIDNSLSWTQEHWRALKFNYGRAPFFKPYAPFFEAAYGKRWEYLVDLNLHIITFLLDCLGIDTPLLMESELQTKGHATERLVELTRKVGATTYLSGTGGKAYLEEEKFREADLQLVYQVFQHPVYSQLFTGSSRDFITDLSAIDLLFSEGPKSAKVLKGAQTKPTTHAE